MKRLLISLLALTSFAIPASAQQAQAFNLWTPKGIAVPNAGGVVFSNPNAIYSAAGCFLVTNPCTRMWAGANTSGGEPTGIAYFESVDGLTSWVAYSGNPISTTCILPKVWQTTAGGTINIYCSAGGGISAYTTTDGVTLTLANATAIASGSSSAWDKVVNQLQVLDIIGGTWYGYYNGENAATFPSTPSQMGLATSPDGINWTKDSGNPRISVVSSNYTFLKVNGTYYGYFDGLYNNSLTGPFKSVVSVFRTSSTSVFGPWTELTSGGVPVSVYYPAIPSDFNNFGLAFTIGDPSIYAINGNLYLYYSIGSGGLPSGMGEAVAFNATPAAAVSGFEGVVGVPSSGAPQLNLVTLGSDSGTGANSNPIGGNWSTIAGTQNCQRASNLIEPSATSSACAAYWNPITWPSNQWSQVSVQAANSASSDAAVYLRVATPGVNTDYDMVFAGPVGGGEWLIQKRVAGTATTLRQNTGSFPLALGDKLLGAINGTSLYLYWNGVLIGMATDSTTLTGSAGLGTFDPSSVTNSQVNLWSGGKFLSPSASVGGQAAIGGKAGVGHQ
jgi:hypothetical protein